ncbi:transposase [Azospirillum sp. Sh1]|uniref:transposase n=1 Tax=Azospirillum sp. Sh1 TaxID=2607285 RepID=UPI00165D7751|nr:transposase [Azospirillum sp. Sh1]
MSQPPIRAKLAADSAAVPAGFAPACRSLEPDVQAVLVLDQAGWHGSRALVVLDNVTLVPLPPCSPELNPVERDWLYLRERFLS